MSAMDPRPVSSASSSMVQTPSSKADQVVHRVYLKTVGVLAESRLTQSAGEKAGERKKDKWFNLIMPEFDLHRQDLRTYQSISSYPSPPEGSSSAIPPLLIAFILDTSELPSGQALLWNRASGRVTLNAGLNGSGKAKERETDLKSGIVLERWTFKASLPTFSDPSSSQQPAPQAYRLGIIHFRALYALVRLLPAYRLFRRLRRTNTGLKLGLKLWSPDGTGDDSESIRQAWEVMERGLVGIDDGLEDLASTQASREEERRSYTLPPLEMFGLEYSLEVDYRSEVDFHVEDLEAVLSGKLAGMEDDFPPTVGKHRADDETRSPASASTGSSIPTGHDLEMSGLERPERRLSGPVPVQSASSNPSPIPLRQGPASVGSFKGTLGRPASTRVPSGLGAGKEGNTPGSIGRWGALGEGLPFAQGAVSRSPGYVGTPDPQPIATDTARRLSGHSIHTPSQPSCLLRPGISSQASLPMRPSLSGSKPSSIGRTSSFLSQAGRSHTHAQLATIGQRIAQPVPISSSTSPPIPGTTSKMSILSNDPGAGSVSPTGFSFSKQPIPRSLTGRPPFASHTSSPFAPGSLERSADPSQSSSVLPGTSMPRYSSYSARRDRLAGSPSAVVGSQGSSGEGTSQQSNPSMLRRSSMRTSYEAGLKRSLENSGSGSGSGGGSGLARIVAEDSEDIQAFLKTLDALPQPPSMAAQAVHTSRSHLPGTPSSLSSPTRPAVSPPPAAGSSARVTPPPARTPTTRAQIDAQLRQMAGNFQQSSVIAEIPASIRPAPVAVGSTNSIGLLSASRPSTASRGMSQPIPPNPGLYRRTPSTPGPSAVHGGSPLARDASQGPGLPVRVLDPLPHSVVRKPSARSLPGPNAIQQQQEEDASQLRSAGITIPSSNLNLLSPQTTGGTNDTVSTSTSGRSRRGRGPVLLRGGFGEPKVDRDRTPGSYAYAKSSVSSSPSHSPVRDFGRLTLVQREREQRAVPGAGVGYGERQAEEELDSWSRSAAGMGMTAVGVRHGYTGYTGPGVVPQGKTEQDKSRARVGLGTAPSSYVGAREEDGEDAKARDGRGRQGRVKSDGEEEYLRER